MLTEGLKELHIISNGVTSSYFLIAWFCGTVVLVGLGIAAYDWWIKRFPHK